MRLSYFRVGALQLFSVFERVGSFHIVTKLVRLSGKRGQFYSSNESCSKEQRLFFKGWLIDRLVSSLLSSSAVFLCLFWTCLSINIQTWGPVETFWNAICLHKYWPESIRYHHQLRAGQWHGVCWEDPWVWHVATFLHTDNQWWK